MRALVLVGLAAVLALAARPAAALSSASKVEKLDELAAASPSHVVQLNTKTYTTYTDAPRNYSIIVVLTATAPSEACDLCQRFAASYDIVADSWHRVAEPGRLYMAVLEYRQGPEIFAKMKIATAPQVWHFPPTEGKLAKPENQRNPAKFDSYDLAHGYDADEFVRFVERAVGREVPLNKPFDPTKFLLPVLVLLVGAAAAWTAWTRYNEFVRNPIVWSVLAMVFTLFFISGHAWNSIRGAPFAGREAISPQFQSQYGLETRFVAVLYGAAAFSFIMLAVHVPAISKPSTQRIFAYAYAGVFFVACSTVVYVFRLKYGPYPYRLLF